MIDSNRGAVMIINIDNIFSSICRWHDRPDYSDCFLKWQSTRCWPSGNASTHCVGHDVKMSFTRCHFSVFCGNSTQCNIIKHNFSLGWQADMSVNVRTTSDILWNVCVLCIRWQLCGPWPHEHHSNAAKIKDHKNGIAQRKSFHSSSNIAHIYILLEALGEPNIFFFSTFLFLRHSDTSWERFTQVCKFAYFFPSLSLDSILLRMFALIFTFLFHTPIPPAKCELRGKGKFDVLE